MKQIRFRRPRILLVAILLPALALFGVLLLTGPKEGPAAKDHEFASPAEGQTAQRILDSMTLEEKVGQMFLVRCRKYTAVSDIETYAPGGYILFAPDIRDHTITTLKSRLDSYQKASEVKLLIGVDEEGGNVVRISKYPEFRSEPFRSPQSLFAEGGYPLIAEDAKEKAALLKSLGINLNLAPVCDISTNPSDFIHERTFGKSAVETAEYVKTVVEAAQGSGLGCTLKHFPGYGGNDDTHKGSAVDERSYESFLRSDFIPFQAGIEAGAGSVMVSHNTVVSMDETLPASLSPRVHEILRNELSFTGVIMTDDLRMDAIKDFTGDEASVVMAIKAGNDLLIASDFDIQIPAVIAAVKDGTISEKRIDESVMRILAWKASLGLLEN